MDTGRHRIHKGISGKGITTEYRGISDHGGYWIQVDNGYRGILDTDDTGYR